MRVWLVFHYDSVRKVFLSEAEALKYLGPYYSHPFYLESYEVSRERSDR